MFFYVTLQAFGHRPWRRPEDDRQPVKVWSTLLLEERGKRNGVGLAGTIDSSQMVFSRPNKSEFGKYFDLQLWVQIYFKDQRA